MGREIYTVITDKNGEIVWESGKDNNTYFCGRYEYTDVIAHFCYTQDKAPKLIRSTAEGEYDAPAVEFTDQAVQDRIIRDLKEVQEDSDIQRKDLEERYADLRECRRHATTVDNFYEFDSALHDVATELRETYWTGAADVIAATEATRAVVRTLPKDASEYRLFWICSE